MSRRLADALGIALVVALLGVNVYRALTQPVTHDEAMTWRDYVAGPWSDFFTRYEANHHVLHTLLCRISVGLFGGSELALRVGGLGGGLLYLAAVLAVSRRLLATPGLALTMQALLSLNPFVLDYLSLARGYGLALGLQVAALLPLDTFLREVAGLGLARARRAPVALASLLASLCVLANLTFLPIALATWFVTFALALRGPRQPARDALRLAWTSIWPALLALLALGAPFLHASKADYYIGVESAWESMQSLVGASLAHADPPVFLGQAAGVPALAAKVASGVVLALLPVLALVAWLRRRTPGSAPLLLCTGSLGVAIVLQIAQSVALDLPYPIERTGLGFVAPFCLACGLAIAGSGGLVRAAGHALLLVLVARFAMQLPLGAYRAWPHDTAIVRALARLDELRATLGRPLAVACSWRLEMGMSFYAATRDPRRFAAFTIEVDAARAYDAFVLDPWESENVRLIERRGDAWLVEWKRKGGGVRRLWLGLLWVDPCGTYIAVPRDG